MKFDYAINLAVTWVNRLLFLKLLEGQLINFNESNTKYEFVNSRVIYDFNKLNELFFGVLAKPVYDRGKLTEIYKNVPYLNSSLFEKSVAESTLSISPAQLDDDVLIGIYTKSVLKKRLAKNTNKLPTLEYLLLFLNSYTFDTDASKVNGENLINSSVLGLIFEKINGYKDGSYYTPGFVTSFMSRNAINKAIVAKFSEHGWKVQSILDIQKSITKENSEDALSILKDFKLVDPAVGSGHFLVSSLNYLVFLRYYFNLMTNTFSLHFNMEIVNDELDIFDGEGNGFTYNRGVDNSLKIQKELFSTKLDIIENNLFGVDINQNSVDITRLRLWIELLKNSYYEDGQLVTMPNLEMNIKVGNSVVSRYELRESLSKMTQNTNLSVSEFKSIVQRYRNTHDKGEKRSLEHIIHKFVQQIRSILTQRQSRNRNKNFQQLNELKKSVSLLDTPIDRKAKRREIKSLTKKINEQKKFYDNADSSLFLNSFEWRFEFPEVLDEQGKFKGFDLVIANPPYIGMQDHAKIFHEVDATQLGKRFSSGKNDFFYYFMHLAIDLLKDQGILGFITTNYWVTATYADKLREDLRERTNLLSFYNFNELKIFSSAKGQHNMITFAKKRTLESVKKGVQSTLISVTSTNEQGTASNQIFEEIVNNKNKKTSTRDVVPKKFFDKESGYFLLTEDNPLLKALEKKISLNSIADTNQGITTGSNDTFVWDESLFETVNLNSYEKLLFKPLIRGSELVEPTASSLSSPKSFIMYMSTKTTNIDRTPNLKSFIENSKDYVRIHERAIEERNEGDQYYLWRERNSQIFKRTSIYYQKRTQNPMFTLNDKGFYIKDDAYAITLKNPNEDDALILLTVLNSTFTHFWLVAKGRKKGKSLELYPEVIRTLPVPNLKLISKEDLQQVKLAVKQLDRRDFKLFANKKVAEWFSLPGVVDEMEEYINNNQ